MDFIIRPALKSDYEALCEIIDEIDALHRNALPSIYKKPDGPVREKDYINSIISDKDQRVLVAMHEGRIVGFINAVIIASKDFPIVKKRKYVKLDTVVVKEEFQRSGIGTRLMEGIHDWAREKGMNQIELAVWSFNTSAISFYNKLGYKTAQQRLWKIL